MPFRKRIEIVERTGERIVVAESAALGPALFWGSLFLLSCVLCLSSPPKSLRGIPVVALCAVALILSSTASTYAGDRRQGTLVIRRRNFGIERSVTYRLEGIQEISARIFTKDYRSNYSLGIRLRSGKVNSLTAWPLPVESAEDLYKVAAALNETLQLSVTSA